MYTYSVIYQSVERRLTSRQREAQNSLLEGENVGGFEGRNVYGWYIKGWDGREEG